MAERGSQAPAGRGGLPGWCHG